MQRMMLAVVLAVVFGAGVVAGSVLLPSAKADPAPSRAHRAIPAPVVDNDTIYTVPGTGSTYFYPPVRWQIVVLPFSNRNDTATLLIDTLTGTTYSLRLLPGDPSGFTWYRITQH